MTCASPEGALFGLEGLLPTCLALPQPWTALRLKVVCRTWRDLLSNCAECWSEIQLRHPSDLNFIPGILVQAGSNLKVLDLSKVGHHAGELKGFGAGLLACPKIEELNLAGCNQVSFVNSPEVLALLSQSLRSLNIRDCDSLHKQLAGLIGSKLQRLEAGWISENNSDRNMNAWRRVFPKRMFRYICNRCPALRVLRVPGYCLYSNQPEHMVPALVDEYIEIGKISTLRHLRRLDLCCAQLLSDPAVMKIAAGCKHLRNLNLRCCTQLSDYGLNAVSQHLHASLVHINVSCCGFSDAAVRKLVTRCSHLKTLDLCYCENLDSSFIAWLSADATLCPNLRMIGAGGFDLSDIEVAAMCHKYRDNLTHLGIGNAKRMTDSGLQTLATLPHLRRLSAHQLKSISANGLLNFCRQAPCLEDLDADDCEYTPRPTLKELAALKECLAAVPYDYDAESDESEDDDEDDDATKEPKSKKRQVARKAAVRPKDLVTPTPSQAPLDEDPGMDFLDIMSRALDSVTSSTDTRQ